MNEIINCCTISLVLCGVLLAMLAMFFNYSLKLKEKSIELEKKESHSQQRIKVLEKKNGAEQRQLDQLKAEIAKLKQKDHTERNNHHDQR